MLASYSEPLHHLLDSIEIPFDISPLVDAIRWRKAVVYVGAGASVPAGLPTWNAFLTECFERGKQASPDESRWAQTARLLKEGDYMTGADLLQKEIGPALEHYVWDIFGHAHVPSPIHFAITRVPFSLAISTNYDRLLESAYKSRPNVWTWRDPAALFSAIKHGRFAIVKVHGDVGNGPSLVLTKTQYRDLMHLNKAFNDCLTTLLSLRTFLFVGSSLRDHDLLRLMDSAKLTYGNDFGPHYAILFDDEFDIVFGRLLLETYNINVILCKRPEPGSPSWKTESVCSVLKCLSGEVAKEFHPDHQTTMDAIKSLSQQRSEPLGRLGKIPNTQEAQRPLGIGSKISQFSLVSASQRLLDRIVEQTGSDLGTIALVKDLDLPGLFVAARTDALNPADIRHAGAQLPARTEFGESRTLLRPGSFLGRFFIHGDIEGSHCYRTNRCDVCNSNSERKADEAEDEAEDSTRVNEDMSGHSEVQSILACHVLADGRTVGVISVESFSRDAYTSGHMEALRRASVAAGAIYLEYRHRTESKQAINPYLADMESFHGLMDISRALKPLALSYLLYDIDYGSGRCEARYAKSIVKTDGPERSFGYWFDEPSLVTKVLETRQREFIEDAHKDLASDSPRLSPEGVKHFRIAGSVLAAPIHVGGYTASILVCWSRSSSHGSELGRSKERVERIARVIANVPKGASGRPMEECERLMRFVNDRLARVDRNRPWTKEMREDPVFRQQIIRALLDSLLHPSCGLARVRLWRQDDDAQSGSYVITDSLTLREATSAKKRRVNAYVGTECHESDVFCQYTIGRAKVEPLAVWQNSSMFGVVDRNTVELDKDPEGSWIVGPIVARKRLLGFVSADTHYRGKERRWDEDTRVFQCRAVDVITDILASLLRINAVARRRGQGVSDNAARSERRGGTRARGE
jgi:hypothetical protein